MMLKTRKTFRRIAFVVAISAAFTACKKDKQETIPEPVNNSNKEYKYLRILVADELSPVISQVNPFEGKVSAFDGKYPLANLYGTASGRYAAVLYQSQNLVEVFDSGLQSHIDHVDVDGVAKWASITADGIKPTHFKSREKESLIFNDGAGTLSLGNDADFNTKGAKFKTINAGLLPHHGAMAQFLNGTYAVTSAASSGASPTRAIVIDKNGTTLFPSTVEVGAIHGNASDGVNAVFGAYATSAASAGGVLVVNQSGAQRFLANPDGFGAYRFGTILYAESAKKFIGYVAAKGAYLIDVAMHKITPMYAGADAFQCKVDYAGKNLVVLTLDGKLRIYELGTGTLKKEGSILSAVNATDTYKPVLEATAKFAYVANPATGEVLQISLDDFSKVIKHKVSARPVKLTLFGFESNSGHND
ncbi:hypothetical protein [Pedobacter nototheniae]|uniref:hypothetical protein n=1 Tax=Pedobacter nototheniae TaxID=2488994 RepID=UPI00292E2C70|nr:hypothetical protein [Pedobacter nototheniae]